MTQLTSIVTEAEIRETIDMCIENGHATYHFDGGRLFLELNNSAFIAGTFYYDEDIQGEPDASNNPEEYVTHLEDLEHGSEQVQRLHNVVSSHDSVVYTHPPKLSMTGHFDFGLQYRNN